MYGSGINSAGIFMPIAIFYSQIRSIANHCSFFNLRLRGRQGNFKIEPGGENMATLAVAMFSPPGSLALSFTFVVAGRCQRLVTEMRSRIPGDSNGGFDAFMGGTSLRMHSYCAYRGFT